MLQLWIMNYFFPRLLLDKAICKQNIKRMAEKAYLNHVVFRPHFKTHQSIAIGQWFRDAGMTAITVSSLKMAAYFVEGGWNDIFIAFPVNVLEMNSINQLAKNIHLSVSIESAFSAEYLNKHLKNTVGVYLKIDTGYHRTGLDPTNREEITQILKVINQSDKLKFIGFYTHAGHTYDAGNSIEIEKIYRNSVDQLMALRNVFQNDFPDLILSVGDTPSCGSSTDFGSIDEIRPGNFIFNDLIQAQIGICSTEDLGIALECPVVAKNRDRKELVIHGGAVHLSKESIDYQDQKNFGLVVPITTNGWGKPIKNTYVKGISQEHGIIKADDHFFKSIQIGDTVGILPVHSCLTANLADNYFTSSGEIISKMRS